MHEFRYLRTGKKGIGIRARLVGRARKSQVGDRRPHGNSDESVCFECHVVAWQYALHESVELSARFDSLSRALGGADHGAKGGGDRCVFGIERMRYDKILRCAVCRRSLHGDFLARMTGYLLTAKQ